MTWWAYWSQVEAVGVYMYIDAGRIVYTFRMKILSTV